MKKLFFALAMAFVAIFGAHAQNTENAAVWNFAATYCVNEMNEMSDDIEEMFGAMGIDVDFKSFYEENTKTIVLDFTLDPAIWNLMANEQIMGMIRDELRKSYQQSYLNDEDFREAIDLMKSNNAKFSVRFSCIENGKLKNKEILITPANIIS